MRCAGGTAGEIGARRGAADVWRARLAAHRRPVPNNARALASHKDTARPRRTCSAWTPPPGCLINALLPGNGVAVAGRALSVRQRQAISGARSDARQKLVGDRFCRFYALSICLSVCAAGARGALCTARHSDCAQAPCTYRYIIYI